MKSYQHVIGISTCKYAYQQLIGINLLSISTQHVCVCAFPHASQARDATVYDAQAGTAVPGIVKGLRPLKRVSNTHPTTIG